VALPGRLERRGEAPLEIRDGAHNLDGIGWLLPRVPDRRYVIVASILGDKDVDGMLAALSALGDTLVATRSSNTRALPAAELARLGSRWFTRTEQEPDPAAALAAAHAIAGPQGAVLVTGSLYLLADLAAHGEGVPSSTGRDSASSSSPPS
jgi:dihydrofolate synthase/folylpolyglutamate synthase